MMRGRIYLAAIFAMLSMCLMAQDSLETPLPIQGIADNSFPADIDSAKFYEFYKKEGIDLTQTNNMALYYEVFRWYKTCYRYSGSSDKGIDCSGFSQMLYKKIYGKDVPHGSYSIYPLCIPIKDKSKLQEGDFVFFTIRSKSRISHVGVYLQNGQFAHASTQAGVIISNLSEAYYTKYWYRGGRLKD